MRFAPKMRKYLKISLDPPSDTALGFLNPRHLKRPESSSGDVDLTEFRDASSSDAKEIASYFRE